MTYRPSSTSADYLLPHSTSRHITECGSYTWHALYSYLSVSLYRLDLYILGRLRFGYPILCALDCLSIGYSICLISVRVLTSLRCRLKAIFISYSHIDRMIVRINEWHRLPPTYIKWFRTTVARSKWVFEMIEPITVATVQLSHRVRRALSTLEFRRG